ncbi:TetR/AcrR family transcriptional regulator [Phenylobacterium sp.]|uniref:TetR/AcrR family transcriptional regulator n=1 Tax=Phenylobacterium sp. TaxID=1871053 RepID=UPI0025CEEA2A|nr:TetR/AcrR family transcriptional regulator [Phenylobacterium sp.]MBX3485490.1 TetR/AcrR family transcriptional regulator [Phenylobacterium sp.]
MNAENQLPTPTAAGAARPKTGRGSKPRVNVPERREAFLLAASRVFLERGVGTATMQDVADAAGVPKILIYRIFRSKEELLDAIRDKVIAKIHEVWGEPARIYGGRLRGLVMAAREQPDPFLLVLRYSHAGVEGLGWRQKVEDAIAAYTLDRWFQTGPDAPPGAAARARYASRLNVGQFIELTIRWIEGETGLDDETLFRYVARIQREFHLASREAFQLGTMESDYRLPGEEPHP